jgi:hypothetical protein
MEDLPPVAPHFPTLAPQSLVITIPAGVIAVKLTCPTSPGENTVLRAGERVREPAAPVPGPSAGGLSGINASTLCLEGAEGALLGRGAAAMKTRANLSPRSLS